MRKKAPWLILAAAAPLAGLYLLLRGSAVEVKDLQPQHRPPRIRPDYAGVVIPPNIAPLNFVVDEPGRKYRLRLQPGRGQPIEVFSDTPAIAIPANPWRQMLAENRGGRFQAEVCVQAPDGRWLGFDAIANTVADDEVDGYLVYRQFPPTYNLHGIMGIYQRELSTFRESAVVTNNSDDDKCMNCHTFIGNRPDKMLLHVRGGGAPSMLIAQEGGVQRVDTRTQALPQAGSYSAWHPTGRWVAYSANKVRQFFHMARSEPRDVLDLDSHLAIYNVETGVAATAPDIARPRRMETFPTWSPDGKFLYFCSATRPWPDSEKVFPPEGFEQVKYDLMRIAFNPDTGGWGKLETVLTAQQTHLSITEPRISPDGRFLLCCMSQYSCAPYFQDSADLYMLELPTGKYWPLECNSDQAESWHGWSSNGRWIVFSSKRDNGLFGRAYFSHIDAAGHASKAFVLPQATGDFYDSCLMVFQVPELITGPVAAQERDLLRAIYAPESIRTATAPAP
jgi:hypothetical protein